MSTFTPEQAANEFVIGGKVQSAQPLHIGHIHNSFIITVKPEASPRPVHYVLQRINDAVFKEVAVLMRNMGVVISHLKKKLRQRDSRLALEVPELVSTRSGSQLYSAPDGSRWRMLTFIEESEGFDRCPSAAYAYGAGQGFGRFLAVLGDLDPSALQEPIPNFQNLAFRLQELDGAIAADVHGRLKLVQSELSALSSERTWALEHCAKALRSCRVIHGDPKFNNVLFKRGAPSVRAIIDLDTCMPGALAFDFGDLIRSASLVVDEDCSQVSDVCYPAEIASSVIRGFVTELRDALSSEERESLTAAPRWVTLMLAARFLSDYLSGDQYFRINDAEQNLRRARVQLELCSQFRIHQADIESAIQGCLR